MDSSKLAERGGLVYYNKSDTPFTGKGIKYWPTGEVQIKATFEAGIPIQSSFLGIDGSLLESTEVIDDTTILIEWFSNLISWFINSSSLCSNLSSWCSN